MRIVVLKYGESVFGENYIFKGGRNDRLLPISFVFYLIQTENKNILVDVGCDDGAGFAMSVFEKPVNVLREYGLEPTDITDVIITHSHHDHIASVRYYKNAVIHIQKEEYELGKQYIPEEFKVNLFEDTCEVSSDVIAKKIGGHSIGSSVVLVGKYVFCGDECYVRRCLVKRIPTGSSYCEEKSMEFIEEYSNDRYIPLIFHDADILKERLGYSVVLDEIPI